MLNQYIRTEKFEVEQTHVVKATRTCDICDFKMSGGKLSQPNTYKLKIEHKNNPITNRDLEYDYGPRWDRECSSEINIIDLNEKELEEKCIEAIKDLPYGM